MANDTTGQMQVMEFRGHRRWWSILGIAVVILLAGLWFAVYQENWVLLVCGAVVLIVWMSLVAPGAFYLKLAPEGMKISDNWWRRSYRWDQIQHIRPVEIDGQPSVGWNFVPAYDWLEDANLFAGFPPIEAWLVLETYGQKAETLADLMFELHSAHAGPASEQKLTAALPDNWSWLNQDEGYALAQSLQNELGTGDPLARHVATSRGRLAGLLSRFFPLDDFASICFVGESAPFLGLAERLDDLEVLFEVRSEPKCFALVTFAADEDAETSKPVPVLFESLAKAVGHINDNRSKDSI